MKRSLFDELSEGLSALESERKGKRTLRHHVVEKRPVPEISAEQLINLRQKLNMSQAVFAEIMRTNKRTVENWEQGRAKPNAQAILLVKMVEKFPDTIDRLASV